MQLLNSGIPVRALLLSLSCLATLIPFSSAHPADDGATATLSGRILNSRGEWVRNVLGNPRAGAGLLARREQGEWIENSRKRSEPTYTLAEIEPGIYNLLLPASHFAGERYRPKRVYGVDVKPGANSLDFTVLPGTALERVGTPATRNPEAIREGWIEGTVLSPDGVPVWGAKEGLEGVRIRLQMGKGVVYPAETHLDAGGFFEARGLAPGVYQLSIPATYLADRTFQQQVVQEVSIHAGHVTLVDLQVSEHSTRPRIVRQSLPLRLMEEPR